jgi:ppGpp synthetase/RelA/SpoT-type nucleotidyltranferase
MANTFYFEKGNWTTVMEDSEFRKKVKEELKQFIGQKEPPERLFSLFKNKIIHELNTQNLSTDSIQHFEDLLNYYSQKHTGHSEISEIERQTTALKTTTVLFSIYLAINLFKDHEILKNSFFIGMIDPLYFEPVFSEQEVFSLNRRYNFYRNDELVSVYKALKKIHAIELPTIITHGLQPNTENSNPQEMLLNLIHGIFKENAGAAPDLIFIKPNENSDRLSEIISYVASNREVLLMTILQRLALLTLLGCFSGVPFITNFKFEIAIESLLIHASIADKIGFRWAKGRIEDEILKICNPPEFNRIRAELKQTLSFREEFIQKLIKNIEKVFRKANTLAVEKCLDSLHSQQARVEKLDRQSADNVLIQKYLSYLIIDFAAILNDLRSKKATETRPAWFAQTATLTDDEFRQLYLLRFKITHSAETEELQKILNHIRGVLRDSNLVAVKTILGRPKNIFSIYRKENERQLSANQHHDLIGLRIIVENSNLFQKILLKSNKFDPRHINFNDNYAYYCYHALTLIQSKFNRIAKFKDFIKSPKCNGYQSLHIVYETKIRKFPYLEIQIRDEKMENFAEYGLAAHWIYERAGKKSVVADSNSANWTILREKYTRQLDKNITVMTENNAIKKIPTHSTVLDFAYYLNPELGHHCNKVYVNNRLVSFDTILKDGDRVKIDCSATQKPSSKWLKFVNSEQAQNNIRHQIKNGSGESS